MKWPKIKLAWLWAVGKRLLAYGALLALILWVLAASGVLDHWARSAIVARVEQITGGRVELKEFRFSFFTLRAEMEDFTLHGREPAGTPPFFHADLVVVDVRVDSLLRRKISLDEVRLVRPAIHVRFDEEGKSNFPVPPVAGPPGKPFRERIFDLVIRQIRLEEGELLVNQVRVPLVAEGSDLNLALDYRQDSQGRPQYAGDFRWRGWQFAMQRYMPTPTDLAVQFTLTPEGLQIKDLVWKFPHSTISVEATLPKFAEPVWQLRYHAELDFADLRHFLRMPNFPAGRAQTQGAGEWKDGQLALDGRYRAEGLELPYEWFHARGLQTSGSYHATNQGLVVPDFEARVLGGVVRGRVDLKFSGMQYATQMRLQGMNVAALLNALDHKGFPVNTLHWDGTMDTEASTAWHHDFQSLDTHGVVNWSPPQSESAQPASIPAGPAKIPASAHFEYHFRRDREMVELRNCIISTPNSRIDVKGRLGTRNSALQARLDTRNLSEWNDFIAALRGPQTGPERVAGNATFEGSVVGALAAPVFSGPVKIRNAAYGRFAWDQIEGEVLYGPQEFRLERATVRRGRSSATLDIWLGLQNWSFRPESGWSLTAELVRAPTDEIQSLFGTNYPARGLLTGQFRARGTRALPEFTGLLDFTEVEVAGLKLDRARGHLQINHEELSVTNAELRKSTGRLTGNFRYRFSDANIVFDAAGAVIPVGQIEWLAAAKFPFTGDLSFQLRGEGPFSAPRAQGTARIVDFGVGDDKFGSFETRLRSDGRLLNLELTSAMAEGSAQGNLELTLAGDYPVRGTITIHQVDLDAFFQTALRLPHASFTGHSRVDGTLRLEGPLAKPRTIAVDAELSKVTFGYEQVRLENEGPVRLTYRAEEVRITQARLRGSSTDFQVSGFARFNGSGGGAAAGGQQLGLNISGQVNLQLLGGFLRDLDTRGSARTNIAIGGTLQNPRINGRATIEDASAFYADFPNSLTRVKGDLVFDAARMTFDNVTAEAGGGQLTLGGSITYGEGPLRYDLGIYATRVRIRYPQGMSWLFGGALRLAGTTRGALLTGRVAVERLLLTEGFDFGSLLVRSEGSGGATASPFLRNFQFDIEAVSAPDARMEWVAARFDCEAQLRVRGTWERPILLGHIHLLSGEMTFRGNRYTLTRGDINFSNPFRLDPVLNVEALTTIRQYEVTLNFTGPASRLTLAYRSDPPLPQSDVIALLALGRTGEESDLRRAGSGQGAEQSAGQMLSEAISSQISGRIERLFGVSRFRIDPFLAGTGTEPNASARITIEQQVTRDLVITYITNVSSNQQQVVQIEYSVNREVSIIGLRDQNGTFGLDVKFKKRFK